LVSGEGVVPVSRFLNRELAADQPVALCVRHFKSMVRDLELEPALLSEPAPPDRDARWTRLERVVFTVLRHGQSPTSALLFLLFYGAVATLWVLITFGVAASGNRSWTKLLFGLALSASSSVAVVAEWRHWRRLWRFDERRPG
jgi:hypothetical protein